MNTDKIFCGFCFDSYFSHLCLSVFICGSNSFFFRFGHALQTGEVLTLFESDQSDALGVAPDDGDLLDARAYKSSAAGDQHGLILVAHHARAHDRTIALADLNRDDALAAAAMFRVILERRTFAVAVR